MNLTILHLYPKEMNLYGDHGNVLALQKRCEWRGIQVNVIAHEPGEPLPQDFDILFGGGGQDSGQGKIEHDLLSLAEQFKAKIEDGTPALLICGLYQLFGQYFQTSDGKKINGAGILPLKTVAGPTRLIGNITINSERFGEIVGYENHSGLTRLGEGAEAFGTVVSGAGNNGEDQTEGIVYKNGIGTYLHGPILPKNPAIADFLITKALERKYNKEINLETLNDKIEQSAHATAATRPR